VLASGTCKSDIQIYTNCDLTNDKEDYWTTNFKDLLDLCELNLKRTRLSFLLDNPVFTKECADNKLAGDPQDPECEIPAYPNNVGETFFEDCRTRFRDSVTNWPQKYWKQKVGVTYSYTDSEHWFSKVVNGWGSSRNWTVGVVPKVGDLYIIENNCLVAKECA